MGSITLEDENKLSNLLYPPVKMSITKKMTDTELMLKHYYYLFNQIIPVSKEEFAELIREDIYGGWEDVGHKHAGGRRESKLLYCMIRLLKPKNILEIGTYQGDGLNHILLAAEKNNNGCQVTTVDVTDYLNYGKLHQYKFLRFVENSLNHLKYWKDYDLVIQDGNHGIGTVSKEVQIFKQMNCHIWAHDVCLYPYIEQCYKNNGFDYKIFKDPDYQAGVLIYVHH